jgi:hypothetical protein
MKMLWMGGYWRKKYQTQGCKMSSQPQGRHRAISEDKNEKREINMVKVKKDVVHKVGR